MHPFWLASFFVVVVVVVICERKVFAAVNVICSVVCPT